MFCKKCGTQIPDDAKFCPSCGADNSPVESTPETPVVEPTVVESTTPEVAAEPVVENKPEVPTKPILILGIIGFLLTFGPGYLIGFILSSIAVNKGKKYTAITGKKLTGGAKVGYILAMIANIFATVVLILALLVGLIFIILLIFAGGVIEGIM